MNETDSVHVAEMAKVDETIDWRSEDTRWEKIMALRDEVLCKLEDLRQNQIICSSQEAAVKIRSSDDDLISVLKDEITEKQFAALCIVSEVEIEKLGGRLYEGEDYVDITKEMPNVVVAEKSSHAKCQRCWNYWPSVGENSDYPDLCQRCVEVVTRGS